MEQKFRLFTKQHAHAYVLVDGNNVALMSYNTPIIVVSGNRVQFNGLYSKSTVQHINAFLREAGISIPYSHIKYYLQHNKRPLVCALDTHDVANIMRYVTELQTRGKKAGLVNLAGADPEYLACPYIIG